MKTHYTAFLLFLVPAFGVLAQPTLNLVEMTPAQGSVYAYNYWIYQDPGSSGAGQTWDFSGLSSTEQHSITFLSPEATSYAATYPTATIAFEPDAPSGIYLFTRFSEDGADALGDELSFGYTHFSDPRRGLKFPFAFNDTWSDAFAGDWVTIGSTGTISGSITGTADGYGTLILPYGTFTNILRVHTHTVTTQIIVTPPPGATNVVNEDSYLFFKPGVAMELLNIAHADNTSSSTFLTESTVGVQEALMQDIGIEVMPNPATDAISVTYGAVGVVKLAVYDALGRAMLERNLGRVPPGIHREQMDVSMLAQGQYVLSITTADGQTGSRRFVVE
jgi:hypothetical protein